MTCVCTQVSFLAAKGGRGVDLHPIQRGDGVTGGEGHSAALQRGAPLGVGGLALAEERSKLKLGMRRALWSLRLSCR